MKAPIWSDKFQDSEELRPVIIRFFRANRVPCDEVRGGQPVTALVEVGPEAFARQAADIMPEESFKRDGHGD